MFLNKESSADVFLTTCSRSGPRYVGRGCEDDKREPAPQNKDTVSEDSRALMLQRSSEMKQNTNCSRRIGGVSKNTAGVVEQKQQPEKKRESVFFLIVLVLS